MGMPIQRVYCALQSLTDCNASNRIQYTDNGRTLYESISEFLATELDDKKTTKKNGNFGGSVFLY